LVVLGFGNGKPKLVNTCPYCNAKLGEEHTSVTSTRTPEEQQHEA